VYKLSGKVSFCGDARVVWRDKQRAPGAKSAPGALFDFCEFNFLPSEACGYLVAGLSPLPL
jgi:hypothetical protein